MRPLVPVAQLAQSSPKAPLGVLYLRSKTPKADDHSVQSNKMTLTTDDLQDLLTLIDFHDDYEEVKDVWGIDLEPLRDKVSDLLTQSNSK